MRVHRVRAEEALELRRIRLAALADTPEAFGSTYEAEACLTEADWRERAATTASGDRGSSWFASVDDEIVGLVAGFRDGPGASVVELVSMWVAREARRRGVGVALVGAVVGWAEGIDASTVGLWVVDGNTGAERLYEGLGFVRTGETDVVPSDPSRREFRMELALGG